MWILPHERRLAAFHGWLCRALAPGEPLWHFAHGERTWTLSAAKAWGAVAGFAREVRDRGVLRSFAEVAVVAAVDSLVDNPNATMGDAVWRQGPGWSPPTIEELAVGLTPQRLILLSVVRSMHEPSLERAYAPAGLVSLSPPQIAAANLRMTVKKLVKAEWIELAYGRGQDEETFSLQGDESNIQQARAILERLAGVSGVPTSG
jgi:hypothetical protein